jgi:hypothetical protein
VSSFSSKCKFHLKFMFQILKEVRRFIFFVLVPGYGLLTGSNNSFLVWYRIGKYLSLTLCDHEINIFNLFLDKFRCWIFLYFYRVFSNINPMHVGHSRSAKKRSVL